MQASTGSDWLLSDARILADSIGSETAFIICAESEEVQKRTLELEQQTASKLAEGGGRRCLQRGQEGKGEAGGDAYAAMHRILRRGLLSFSPEKRRSGGSRKLLGRTGRGAACAAAQKRELPSVLISAMSGETRKGSAHIGQAKRTTSEKWGHGAGQGLQGMQGMHAGSGAKGLWGLRGGARVEGNAGA